jgi:hypothetical protein
MKETDQAIQNAYQNMKVKLHDCTNTTVIFSIFVLYRYLANASKNVYYTDIFYNEFYLASSRFLTQITVAPTMTTITHMLTIMKTVKSIVGNGLKHCCNSKQINKQNLFNSSSIESILYNCNTLNWSIMNIIKSYCDFALIYITSVLKCLFHTL